MAWIKSNPHLLALILLAVAALATSGLLVLNAQGFSSKFDEVRATPPKGTKVPQIDAAPIQAARTELSQPATWTPGKDSGSLFVSERYMIGSAGDLQKPGGFSLYSDSLTKKPIPNQWFLDHHLPLLTPGVARQDPDKDGFSNEDEWRAEPSTDPNDPKSHPPYFTRLFLKLLKRTPFRLKFQSWDGDAKKPEEMTFQINTLDLRQPTAFLHIGEAVSKTKFKIQKFEEKHAEKNGIQEDTSELTLLDTEFNVPVVLIMNKVVDSPDIYGNFTYLWNAQAQDITIKKGQQFALKPEVDQRYKLLDISDNEAQIQTPSGQTVTIPKLPTGYP